MGLARGNESVRKCTSLLSRPCNPLTASAGFPDPAGAEAFACLFAAFDGEALAVVIHASAEGTACALDRARDRFPPLESCAAPA